MFIKIDWISFTIRITGALSDTGDDTTHFVDRQLLGALGPDLYQALFSLPMAHQGGRAPYQFRYMRSDAFVNVLWGEKQNHILVEISGGGCDDLMQKEKILLLVKTVQARLTRLDVACDMETDATPADFVESMASGRFVTRSDQTSPSGDTIYLGSRQSDRFCRVYRYSKPHPRSHLLRCEYVLKKRNAQIAAGEIFRSDVETVAAQHGNLYGWQHAAWQPSNMVLTKPDAYRAERSSGKTEKWLIATAMPALARLVEDGTIPDLEDWLFKRLHVLLDK